MSHNDSRTAISPHTEYSHGRVRCPRCGTVVPDESVAEGDVHCEPT